MQNLFLAQTQQGKNAWWRYALGAAGIFVFWQVGTAFVLVAVGALDERSTPGFALGLASFAFLLLGTWLCNRLLHGRSVRSLTTPFARLSWTRMIAASALWVAISALASAVEAVLYPARYAFNGVSADFWPYLAIGLVLIPLQTTAEEYFFRGYLLQASGRLTQNPIILSALNGLLFTLPHLANVEAGEVGLLGSLALYGGMGFLLSWVTLRTQTLEMAIGIHAANNLFAVHVVNNASSSVPAPSLFSLLVIDAAFASFTFLVAVAVFIAILEMTALRRPLQKRDVARA